MGRDQPAWNSLALLLEHLPIPRRSGADDFAAFLRTASPQLDRMRWQSLNERAAAAPQFNVFRIIGREHYEVTTHSALLAALLNPLGTHAQGSLFLESFLRRLTELRPIWKFPPIDARWRVTTEENRIDVLLTHLSTPFFLIIENKWFAPDQELQTFRYWRLLHQKYPTKLASIPVIYLTRTGYKPYFNTEPDDPRFHDDLLPISYSTDMIDILERCLPVIGAARVRETIDQYLQLLRGIDEN